MVVGAYAAAAALNGIVGHFLSDRNNDRDQSLQSDAAQTWQGDRQHIQNEYNELSSQYSVTAPPAITSPEAFDTWSHEDIWKALNGDGENGPVDQATINAGADGWRKLVEQANTAIAVFGTGVQEVVDAGWNGRSGSAAREATQAYVTEFATLAVSFQQVANGIDLIQGYLDQAKLSVPPPENVNFLDEFLGHIPGNGVLKLGKHRANEAEARAQEVMKAYQAGAIEVDNQTPVLPEPKSPVHSPGSDQPDSKRPTGGGGPSGTGGAGPYTPDSGDPAQTEDPNAPGDGTTEDPAATDDPSAQNPSTGDPWSDPTSTDPAATNPASTIPSSNLPSGLNDPSSRPSYGTPGSGYPGAGTPSTPGSTPSPGAGIPGVGSTAQPAGSGTGTSRTAAGTGRMGMPGMGGMAGRGGNGKDDESEHKIPDYLVQDRATELLGEQPRVLPPGGVIGG
ncbi:PPE domain-containing protein [Nocardia farcinica]|uniref:PPE domain-containing protein n=1 Tax=Nocardia farcinica TaxID=37329 RepID=UPI002456CAC1|nr:hypothetical protein [Nocardia farcinica]